MKTHKDFSKYEEFTIVLRRILDEKHIFYKEDELNQFASIYDALKYYGKRDKKDYLKTKK